MRLITSLLFLCFLFFQSCEMLENNSENTENNQSSEVKPKEIKKVKPQPKKEKIVPPPRDNPPEPSLESLDLDTYLSSLNR